MCALNLHAAAMEEQKRCKLSLCSSDATLCFCRHTANSTQVRPCASRCSCVSDECALLQLQTLLGEAAGLTW